MFAPLPPADIDRGDVSNCYISERCRLNSVFDDLQRNPVHRIRADHDRVGIVRQDTQLTVNY